MAACPAFDPTGPYVSQVVSFVDCHSLALGVDGYRALGPSTTFGMALTGLLTIYVATIGYRLLLGGQITLREGLWSALRIGFVLSLATQWAAYQPLVYDVVTAGPADLASHVLAPGGVGGDAPGQLIDRVQGVHAALIGIIPPLPPAEQPSPVVAPIVVAGAIPAAPAPAAPAASAGPTALPPPLSVEERMALISADRLLVATALMGTLSVRVITALLLALGPLFIACMLFDATRGVFVGWVRVLAGATLAGVAAALVISLELAVIEPQVVALRDLLEGHQPAGQLPQNILATCGCFAVIMLAALIALARSTAAFRLPVAAQRQMEHAVGLPESTNPAAHASIIARQALPDRGGERGRAEQVADAARAIQRRDAQAGGNAASAVAPMAARAPASRLQEVIVVPLPLGQTGRRTPQRLSSAAGRRDGGRREAG